MNALSTGWSMHERNLFRFCFLFVVLFMLTLSFPHPYIPDIPGALAKLFEPLIKWIGDEILKIKRPYAHEVLSDSTGLYIHLLILVIISAAGTLAWALIDKKTRSYKILLQLLLSLAAWYLAFHMLVYGFNKVFKWQFFFPEPNTLFTTLGDTHRDLLYWSTMGTSHSYNVFLGTMELIAAVLLFIRRTRLLGALFSFGIMLNIVLINFSFDISVKLFSLFLLFLSLLLIVPHFGRLMDFFIRGKLAAAATDRNFIPGGKRKLYFVAKAILFLFLSWSVLSTYVQSGNYNDDRAERPVFHGAYDVRVFIRNQDTLAPLLTDSFRFRRIFVHRRGYLIIQNMQDKMKDYILHVDTISRRWFIEDERTGGTTFFTYNIPGQNKIELRSKMGPDSVTMQLDKIDLSKLNLLKKEFNWTMD